MCESCLEDRLEEERRSQLVYSRATIYVRQVDKIGALTDIHLDAPSTLVPSSATAEDPDFQVKQQLFSSTIIHAQGKRLLFNLLPFQSSIVYGADTKMSLMLLI